MTLLQFKTKAEASNYNSCNAWGFGGQSGTIYQFGRFTFRDLRQYYRHTGYSKTDKYFIDGEQIGKGEFLKLIKEIE